MDLLQLTVPAWQLVVRCVVIDIVLLVALRVFGKREIGQFTLYDLVLILLVANAVQPAMTGPDTSMTAGLLIIGVLVLFNWVLGKLDQNHFFHRLLVSPPRVIIRDGRLNLAAMEHEGLDRGDAEMAAREHGIADISDVKLGVLESDGTISIIAKPGRGGGGGRHRVRFVRRS